MLPVAHFDILYLIYINPAEHRAENTVWTWQAQGDAEEWAFNEDDKVSAWENEQQQRVGMALGLMWEAQFNEKKKRKNSFFFLSKRDYLEVKSLTCSVQEFRGFSILFHTLQDEKFGVFAACGLRHSWLTAACKCVWSRPITSPLSGSTFNRENDFLLQWKKWIFPLVREDTGTGNAACQSSLIQSFLQKAQTWSKSRKKSIRHCAVALKSFPRMLPGSAILFFSVRAGRGAIHAFKN